MPATHIKRIQKHLDSVFSGLIDLSDVREPDPERRHFLTRAQAAYILTHLADLDPAIAAAAVTDGFDDRGIDALYFSEADKVLYLIQSKWSEAGKKGLSQGDNFKFLAGFKQLLLNDLTGFNERIRSKAAEVEAAATDVAGTFRLILVSTAEQPLSPPVQRDIDDALEEVNGQNVPIAHFQSFDQKGLYKALLQSVEQKGIDVTITLHEWGMVTEPYRAYYGQVTIGDVLDWKQHGASLLKPNLRNILGPRTEVHESISHTLNVAPQHFWYFNNGATILCRSLEKQPKYGDKRNAGIFECKGIGVVNGAQTIGAIWASAGESLDPCTRLQLRLISLEACADGFDLEVTRACNTQIRIERRDFAALDPNQARLAKEMHMDGKRYVYRSGDEDPKGESGCSITDATVALACANPDISLAVQSKREVSKLWESIEREPYTLLFNDQLTAEVLWRAVRILRAVEATLKKVSMPDQPRAGLISVHGNRFILFRVFQDPQVKPFRDPARRLEDLEAQAARAAHDELRKLVSHVMVNLSGSYPQSLFKNTKRCREIHEALNQERNAQPRVIITQSSLPGM